MMAELNTDPIPISLSVNGRQCRVEVDTRRSLADLLRLDLGLTGTKIGCNQGGCGACTVHVDGKRVLACLRLAVTVEGCEVLTIEGLTHSAELHPVQRAFVEHDALQCGFCTPGQIMSAVGALAEGVDLDSDSLAETLSGNLCRCSVYPRIVRAVQEAGAQMSGEGRTRCAQ
jgi:xanthine dehydrogenase YagT iron-sulfur-binding subunit